MLPAQQPHIKLVAMVKKLERLAASQVFFSGLVRNQIRAKIGTTFIRWTEK